MNPLSLQRLAEYWADPELGASILIIFNLVGALLLGALVGYERTFRSRAAGMRTLGLVCMGSAAFTIVCGYSPLWFGGLGATAATTESATRVIQGIITGIGFLGGGVIVKEGMQISGLTTAAAIWVVSGVGVLIGVGLYPAAIALAFLSTAFTMWGSKFEASLPAQTAVMVTMKFTAASRIGENDIKDFFRECGYIIARNTISIMAHDSVIEWRFVAVGRSRKTAIRLPALAERVRALPDLTHYNLTYARN
jgi:putative Mg2+ transporter-C (MgtC) family protein